MIWLAVLALAAVALTPLGLAAWRRGGAARGRRESALALHRAQLDDLERDRAEGRLPESEHASASLEVQRRLLAEAGAPEPPDAASSRLPLIAVLVVVPVAALGLYRIGGQPNLPAAPLQERVRMAGERAQQDAGRDDRLIATLREKLKLLDRTTPEAREGYILLGNAEANRKRMQAAADAWRIALNAGFDPLLAVETAEAITEAAGQVTDESRALFTRALAEAPPGAPWRAMAEKRLLGGPIGTAPMLGR